LKTELRIGIITEGGLNTGMGHVQQSLTVAQEIRNRAEIRFLTTSGETAINYIRKAGFDTIKFQNDDEALNILLDVRPSVVIFDMLNVGEGLAREIKETLKAKLVIFTNRSAANRYADIVVSPIIGSQFKNKKFRDKITNTLYFYGPKYWVLRKEFYEFRDRGKPPKSDIGTIVLVFGGSDPSNLTSAVLEEILYWKRRFKINVILGTHFTYLDELEEVLARYSDQKDNVKIYKNASNVAELMYKADLVITSPGLSVFEALCVGTPVIAMHQNSFQEDSFKHFLSTIAKDEVGKIKNIIANADFIDPSQKYITRLEIGEGKTELIEHILTLQVS